MAYFPVFLDLRNRKVLIVGGGKVATRKVKNLLPFTKDITVLSPKVTKELKELIDKYDLRWLRRRFRASDLRGVHLVIVAVDDIKLQKRIFRLCEKRGILCNAVDSPEFCNFIFPSIIKRGDLILALSTSGKVPALSRALREKLEECIPENIEEILKELERLRSSLPKGKERQRLLLELARKLLSEEIK
ncbi:precorrin-2 dehydrogenase/sirohydrochlorin ferrochelatase family protein [Aquifex sp.]